MMLAGLTYLFNIIQLLYINKISIYVASAVLGMGAPILWTAQGTFLSNNSDARTVTHNFGVLWAMNTSSTFIGNLFAFYLFKYQELIEQNKRMTLGLRSYGGFWSWYLSYVLSETNTMGQASL